MFLATRDTAGLVVDLEYTDLLRYVKDIPTRNQAWAVLGDPARRAAYDLQFDPIARRGQGRPGMARIFAGHGL